MSPAFLRIFFKVFISRENGYHCLGSLEGSNKVSSVELCRVMCAAAGNEPCLWVSYNEDSGSCTMLNDCHARQVEGAQNCTTYEKSCPLQNKKGKGKRQVILFELMTISGGV